MRVAIPILALTLALPATAASFAELDRQLAWLVNGLRVIVPRLDVVEA